MRALFGKRMRRTTAAAAVAAAAFAALSASQAPGVTDAPSGGRQTTETADVPDTAGGDDSYFTDIPLSPPDLNDPDAPTNSGIPKTVLDAYMKAETALRGDNPGCNLPWQLLAAIGQVESGHARGGKVDANGTTSSPILGPPLNGEGFAKITDTDGGAYDGDTTHDRAVGPMQFIPSTWETWSQDGNGDGKKDPNNVYDAALAAGKYLCANNRDLSKAKDLRQAILSYNRSTDYLNLVLKWMETFKKGGVDTLPDGTGPMPDNRNDDTTPDPDPDTDGGNGGTGNPGGGKPGGGATDPGDKPDPKPDPDPDPEDPDDPAPVTELAKAGAASFTATEGSAFADTPTVKAATASGAGVGKVLVRFTIVGDTDASFGGSKSAEVRTGADGQASAPALQAGEKTGEFTIRATTTAGSRVLTTDFSATVTARQADALTSATATLTGAPGAAFTETAEVKATLGGAAAPGVKLTATMVKNDAGDPNDAGPYFKDADGKAIRTLTLTTGADGTVKLPAIYADDTAGTYKLRLLAPGGGKLDVELKVAPAESPSPSPDPTP
ncbi:lytic murein transglycosylase [Streptomyces sp. NPDC050418]|uniref:lytic murein transglycosylase n=1 Tax=Streptomyces sp. NPDC050418 TaxID=3365612 RepID=UPI0037BC63DA